jgi:hypothetical protein
MTNRTLSPRGVAGVVAVFIGGVWLAQGLDLLKGSPMTGVGFWAGAGAVLLVVGIALLVWDVRRDRS